jgi:hypothetical protein
MFVDYAMPLLLLLLLLPQGMSMPISMGKGRRLFGKDSLIHKNKWMGMKGASFGKGYVAAASYGKVRSCNWAAMLHCASTGGCVVCHCLPASCVDGCCGDRWG